MYNQFMNPNVDRINRQIEDLNNLKQQMMQPQAPINNYINTGTAKVELEAKMLGEGQTVSDVIVQNRTLFIDEANRKISIKELDGTISKEYEIVIPKTKEQLKIEELENSNAILMNKLNDMEAKLNEYEFNKSNRSTNDVKQSNSVNNGNANTTAKANSQ